MTDYSNSRYWAISSIGYGKGDSEEEARENYVTTQLRNWAHMTYSGPSESLEDALRNGEARPVTYLAPEGVDGFVLDSLVRWTKDGSVVRTVEDDDVLTNPYICDVCGSRNPEHLEDLRKGDTCRR